MSMTGTDSKIVAIRQVIATSRLTASESHVIRARVRTAKEIGKLLPDVWEDGDTITNIVTSLPVPRRTMNLQAENAG
jgi:Lrp/AsnC family leucine-responsive transcriptional regulator